VGAAWALPGEQIKEIREESEVEIKEARQQAANPAPTNTGE